MKFIRGNRAGHAAPTPKPSATLSLSGTGFPGDSNPPPAPEGGALSVSGTEGGALSVSGAAYLPPPPLLVARLQHRLAQAVTAVGAQFLFACITASFFLAAICGAFTSKKKRKEIPV